MGVHDEDDISLEWEGEAAKTILDGAPVEAAPAVASEPITAPHDAEKLPGYEIGFRAGFRAGTERKATAVYKEGQADIRSALRSVLLLRGLNNEETAHLVEAVWKERTRL